MAVLMATRNGDRHLPAQLDSLEAQSHTNWTLWASDDASTDRTLSILEAYRRRWGSERLRIVRGPGRGATANFMSLICHPDIDGDSHAFSDQDDVWDADKLSRALSALESSADGAALYCGRTRLIDKDGLAIGQSWLFPLRPGFRNALAQNIAGGNTMVMNRPLVDALRQVGADAGPVLHDWWVYLLATGMEGRVIYDPKPALAYRQHDRNEIGSNLGFDARLERARHAVSGRLKEWNNRNIAALLQARPLLTPASQRCLDEFVKARSGPLPQRAWHLIRSGVHRQHLSGNLGLLLALLMNRL